MLLVRDTARNESGTSATANTYGRHRDVDVTFYFKQGKASRLLSVLSQNIPLRLDDDSDTLEDRQLEELALRDSNDALYDKRVFANPVRLAITWANEFPELLQYYTMNIPDYTGMGLYGSVAYPSDHRRLTAETSDHLAAQIMVSETANLRATKNPLRVLELRSFMLSLVNSRLRLPKIASSTITMGMIISLCAACLVSGDSHDFVLFREHLKGLKALIDIRQSRNQPIEPWFVQLLREFDNIHSFLSDQPAMLLPHERKLDILVRPDHPFRKSMHPRTSNVSTRTWQQYIMTIFASSAQSTFRTLYKLQAAVESCCKSPYSLSPTDFLEETKQMETYLVSLGLHPEYHSLNHPNFSRYDIEKHDYVVEAIRRTALFLINLARHVILRGATSQVLFDASSQLLLQMLVVEHPSMDRNIALWALLTVAPLIPPRSESGAACLARIKVLCDQIGVPATFEDVRAYMEHYYYLPQIQEFYMHNLWNSLVSS